MKIIYPDQHGDESDGIYHFVTKKGQKSKNSRTLLDALLVWTKEQNGEVFNPQFAEGNQLETRFKPKRKNLKFWM